MKKRQADFVRKYMRELRHALPINYPNQKKILHSIKQNLINYINENPYSDYSNLTNEFGTPLDTAISFMNEMPEETFSESLKKRKKIFLISIILLIICTATIITLTILQLLLQFILIKLHIFIMILKFLIVQKF